MNNHNKKWIKKIIVELEEPFTAQNVLLLHQATLV